LTIRYGIRWDGKGGKPKPARIAAVALASMALLAPAGARASVPMEHISGGAGIAALAPDGDGVDVALVDTGVAPVGALAEAGRVVYGPDFSRESHNPRFATLDTFGHGTHVAGLIAGTAPGARLVSIKVAGAQGETELGRVLRALQWVREHRYDGGRDVRVVNLSLGVEGARAGYRHDLLAWAVEQLWNDGIAVVAAGGNLGTRARTLDIPAADPFIIAAGASNTFTTADPSDDRVADFSSRSARRPVDVVAPGVSLVSLRVPGSALDLEFPAARVGDDGFRGSGTSQSAAVLTGVAARLLSAHPDLEPDQLKAMLMQGAVDLPDPAEADGAGRVDLAASLGRPVPDAEAVRQRWAPAAVDARKLKKALNASDSVGAVNAEWAGRRWSGRRWSGRRWSGDSWVSSG
jgi:serine protease AprX